MERPASRASWGSGSTRSLASQKRHIEQLKQQKADFEQVASASAQNCACVCALFARARARARATGRRRGYRQCGRTAAGYATRGQKRSVSASRAPCCTRVFH